MGRSIKLFVLAGTQRFPFGRLICALNQLVESGLYMPEEIVMQASVFPVEPRFTHQYKPWLSHTAELVEYIKSIL